MDAVLNMLTSANYEEFGRVLKRDGLLIKVVPAAGYLKEIRELFGSQLRKKEYSGDEVVEYFNSRVKLIERKSLCYEWPVDADLFRRFVEMTPMTQSVDTAKADLSGASRVTIDLDILVGTL
jgi:23S rRNA (guanine745-N1)-methyltransferase